MKAKTLLIAAAALAAGVMHSQAQVYSQNIVGYVNQVMNAGFNQLAVPLDLPGGNYLTNIIPNSVAGGYGGPNGGTANNDYSLVSVYNGVSYTVYTMDSSQPTGVANQSDTGEAVPNPTINPGTMFFWNSFDANTPQIFTNTYVGTVHVDFAATGSQTVGSTTNLFGAGNTYLASKLPIGGGISSVLNLTNLTSSPGNGPLDFDLVEIPNLVTNGTLNGYPNVVAAGYQITTIDSDYGTGFANQADTAVAPEPQIPIGTGFILNTFNGNTTSGVWSQGF